MERLSRFNQISILSTVVQLKLNWLEITCSNSMLMLMLLSTRNSAATAGETKRKRFSNLLATVNVFSLTTSETQASRQHRDLVWRIKRQGMIKLQTWWKVRRMDNRTLRWWQKKYWWIRSDTFDRPSYSILQTSWSLYHLTAYLFRLNLKWSRPKKTYRATKTLSWKYFLLIRIKAPLSLKTFPFQSKIL